MLMFVAAVAAVVTPATPIYLKCTFAGNGAVLNVTADEPNSSVTSVLESSGYTEKYPAAFTADQVRFESRLLAYVINRVDLKIQRTIKSIDSTDAGSCALVTTPKRAF